MAQNVQSKRRKQKMQLIMELKAYIDTQKVALYYEYRKVLGDILEKETVKAKRARKVYETIRNFNLTVREEDFMVDLTWFDDFNGQVIIKDADIDSQRFCFAIMVMLNSLNYRIMSALQDYDPNGWCFNPFWNLRTEMRNRTSAIFVYYEENWDA